MMGQHAAVIGWFRWGTWDLRLRGWHYWEAINWLIADQFIGEKSSTSVRLKMASHVASVTELSPSELYELMYHLKQCNESAPEEMRRLLQEQPEFTRAVAQAQLKLGLIKEQQASAAQPATTAAGVSTDVMQQLDPEQQELLEQVQNLAPEVIQSLPLEERRQIMELREAMGLPPV
jgi:hypothetical protein